ncbi:hypothetical protein BDV06DRAFT_224556 [Aspergillus oleicola]
MHYRKPSFFSSSASPAYPRQGGGQKNRGTTESKPGRQGPQNPHYPRGQAKGNASAPVNNHNNFQGGDHRRQHANPPRRNNNQNNRNDTTSNGAENNPCGCGRQTRPSQSSRNNTSPNGSAQPRQHRRSDQGVFGRKNPRPVIKRGLDYDNDSTMTGMPSIYTPQQWERIQHMRRLREQQELQAQRCQAIELDSLMADAPALDLTNEVCYAFETLDI